MTKIRQVQNAYILDARRTPLGKGRNTGAFFGVHAVNLADPVVREIINKNNIDPKSIEDVILGCVTAKDDQAFDVARTVAMKSLGITVPGVQINRLCGSGLEAVDIAATKVMAGNCDRILAGGLESMSRIPMSSDNLIMPEGMEAVPVGISAELIAEEYKLSRLELDEFSYLSHKKAAAARDNGFFKREIIPIQTPNGLVSDDEGIRADTTVEKLLTLKTPFKEGGVITPGNSSQTTDGAAILLIGNDNAIKDSGYTLKPRAIIIDSCVVGSDPRLQLMGPADAIPKVLKKAGLTIDDIDLVELNEAFAAMMKAVDKELTKKGLKIPDEKLNVNGGAIALGHPLGASGARLLVTLLHELERRNLKRGLAALCIGNGQAIAMIIERV